MDPRQTDTYKSAVFINNASDKDTWIRNLHHREPLRVQKNTKMAQPISNERPLTLSLSASPARLPNSGDEVSSAQVWAVLRLHGTSPLPEEE